MRNCEPRHAATDMANLENHPERISEEHIRGVLENVFGLKLSKKTRPLLDEARMAETLINVFGVKLPSEMVPNAYSILLQEHSL